MSNIGRNIMFGIHVYFFRKMIIIIKAHSIMLKRHRLDERDKLKRTSNEIECIDIETTF